MELQTPGLGDARHETGTSHDDDMCGHVLEEGEVTRRPRHVTRADPR
jgi:hypothetical protein